MEMIVEMRFGSHLYGTATPRSDIDIKAVYIPQARDILLQRVEATIARGPSKDPGEKNVAGDEDHEILSLQRYLELLAEGQTMALDMLFAPDTAMTRPPAPLWRTIQDAAPRLVSRRASAFLRYCQQQANKYGIKGSRVSAARHVHALLVAAEAAYGPAAKLVSAGAEVSAFVGSCEQARFVDLPSPGGQLLRHLEVCGKKMPFNSSIKAAREMAQKLVADYGQRALQAERNEGVDWKSLSHAVRVGREALELLQTGRITFPLPYAAHILSVKQGELPYAAVAGEIEELFHKIEAAAINSLLPNAPDIAFIDELVASAYRTQVECAS